MSYPVLFLTAVVGHLSFVGSIALLAIVNDSTYTAIGVAALIMSGALIAVSHANNK
jgi:hypothetical protein